MTATQTRPTTSPLAIQGGPKGVPTFDDGGNELPHQVVSEYCARLAFVRIAGATREFEEFFRHLLEKRWLAAADQEKGRLRTFLVTALKHFMAKEWRRASAQKRGGGQTHVPMDTAFAENRYAAESATQLPAEAVFDQQWAFTVLDLTTQRLEAEFRAAGKAREFAVLKGCLMAAHGMIDYASVAAGLGVSEGAAQVAVHRLRKRFRELYREEIAQTLPDRAELDAELRYLAGIVAQS